MINPLKYIWNKIYRFFLWSSGADLEILDEVPHEQNKYFGIGGTIIFTAMMASFAGGYAFFTAFRRVISTSKSIDEYGNMMITEIYSNSSYIWAIIFGIFWGALIYNLDRYIVSTFGVGDGKKTIGGQEIVEGLPRIIMAVLLGFVIAVPLELKIFEKSINVEIQKMIDEDITTYNVNNPYTERIQQVKNENIQIGLSLKNNLLDQKNVKTPEFKLKQLAELKDELKIINDQVSRDYSELRFAKLKKEEYNNTNNQEKKNYWNGRVKLYQGKVDAGNTKYWNKERNRKSLQNQLNNANDESLANLLSDQENLKNKKLNLETELKKLKEDEQRLIDKKNSVVKGYGGILGRLIALDRISYKKVYTENPIYPKNGTENELSMNNGSVGYELEKTPVWYAKWLITLLLISIEIAPLLFKMMTERSNYDDKLDRIRNNIKNTELLAQSKMNQEINSTIKINNTKMKLKEESDLISEKKLLEHISEAQIEIAIVAIEGWKKEELKKAKVNPSKIVKSKKI